MTAYRILSFDMGKCPECGSDKIKIKSIIFGTFEWKKSDPIVICPKCRPDIKREVVWI
ncbi:hypothetical protein LCGC14_1642320 [marine sediment metagenome]|uniref:Uncharacterized protein n=1 Tax=marine sediment metagenome TaxID=412755 RepID=A0A0F9ILS2_9ZZZZ